MAEVECPFCGVKSEPFVIQTHIEEEHADGSTTFDQDAGIAEQLAQSQEDLPANAEQPFGSKDGQWTKCTRPCCGEYVLMGDVDEHLAVHNSLAASASGTEEGEIVPSSSQSSKPTPARQAKLKESRNPRRKHEAPRKAPTLLEYFSGRSYHGSPPAKKQKRELPQGQLGRRELGPHAFEKGMPDHVRRHLLTDALPHQVNKLGKGGKLVQETVIDNETESLIPLLATLCSKDTDVEAAYFCHPSTKHIHKLRCDGNFCGYWNIQMLLSYLIATDALPNLQALPNVLRMQETIEQAWSHGILPHGRTETGGICGTRKWIGTSEAAAYFTQLGVCVEPLSFEDSGHTLAAVALLDHVEAYFIGGLTNCDNPASNSTSHVTDLPPIYFQRLGHSMTIVGLQRNKDGSRELLVFDPSLETSGSVRALLAGRRSRAEISTLLRPYRRSDQALARWEEFEIVVPRVMGGKKG